MNNGCLIFGGSIGFFVINLFLAKEDFLLLWSSFTGNNPNSASLLYIVILMCAVLMQLYDFSSWVDDRGGFDSEKFVMGERKKKPLHPDSWPFYLASCFGILIFLFGICASILSISRPIFAFLAEYKDAAIILFPICVVFGLVCLVIAFFLCYIVGYLYFYIAYIFLFSQLRFSYIALGISVTFTLFNFFEHSEWTLITLVDHVFAFAGSFLDLKLSSFFGLSIYSLQISRSIYNFLEKISSLVGS